MDDNFIYDDLVSHGDLGAIIHDLQTRKNELELHVASLEEDIKKLCDKITEMKRVQDNLSRNISELFNTARNELNRKDRRIADLQKQLDDLIFKRNTTQSNYGNKRKREVTDMEESNKKSRNETVGSVPFKNEGGTDKSVHKEGERLIERVNTKSYSEMSRKEGDHDGKTPYSRENSYRRERSAQNEEDSHKRTFERSNRDSNSYDSSKQESDRGVKTSYSKEDNHRRDKSAQKEEGSHRSMIGRSNLECHDSSKHESDRGGKSYSRDNNNRRDRRDDHKNKRDSYRDTNSLKDNRGGQRDHRDQRGGQREQRERNRSYRDNNELSRNRNNDHRNSRRDYRDSYDGRDNQRGNKNTHSEDAKNLPDSHRIEESRNPRSDKMDGFNHTGDQQIGQEPKGEPVFSVSESIKSPSENIVDKVHTLDCSREDGELSDEEISQVPEVTKKAKVAPKKMDFGKNLPFDEKKSFSVYKFVEKQKGMLKKDENLVGHTENNNVPANNEDSKTEDSNIGKKLEKPESKDRKMLRNTGKRMQVQNIDPGTTNERVENEPESEISGSLKLITNVGSKEESSKTKQNEEPNEERSKLCTKEDSSKNIEPIPNIDNLFTKDKAVNEKDLMDEIRQLSSEENLAENVESNEEDTNCDNEKNNTNVNIISQVILNEGMKKASTDSSKPGLENQNKSQENKDKNKPPVIAPKPDKPKRESRVPRNLTEELNIKLDRSDKMKKYMTQLFGSPETKLIKPFEQFSPTPGIGLSHDGEIPELELLSCRENIDKKRNIHASDVPNTTNPVTEFQIFKSNLQSLEKSNSLSNIVVQIQTPDNSTESKEPVKKSISENRIKSFKQKELSVGLTAKEDPGSTQGTVENIVQSSNDACNVSLDLLNMDIGHCKAEDFPNLVVHSDLKDMSDLLLTPVNSAMKNVSRTQTSAKTFSDENKPSNQKPAINNKLSGQFTTDKSVPHEKVVNDPKESSNISNKDKKPTVTKKIEKIVSAKNVNKSPRKCTIKNKMDKKSKTIESNIKKDNPVVAIEKICYEKLKNGQSSEQETNVNKDSKDINNEKTCKNTNKSSKQKQTNVNKATVNQNVAASSEEPTGRSKTETNVHKEPPDNAIVNLEVANSINNSCKKRRRCVVKWV